MKEKVSDFEQRTGRIYEPLLVPDATRLSRSQWCPTLFRFPGPFGLLSILQGSAAHLSEGPGPVWLSQSPQHVRGPEVFGTLALLQPLHAMPTRGSEQGTFWIPNVPPNEEVGLVWVPPDHLTTLPYDTLRTPEALQSHIGDGYWESLHEHLETIGRYTAELESLAVAGAEAPTEPWFTVEASKRRSLLEGHGVEAPWSA